MNISWIMMTADEQKVHVYLYNFLHFTRFVLNNMKNPVKWRKWVSCAALKSCQKLYCIGLIVLQDLSLFNTFNWSLSLFIWMQAAPDAVFSTAVTALKPEDAFDPNRVKCVVDNRGYAIYFSRGLIPYNKWVYQVLVGCPNFTHKCSFRTVNEYIYPLDTEQESSIHNFLICFI